MLVDGGVLAQVETAQMGAEGRDGAPERLHPMFRQVRRAVGGERLLDHTEIGDAVGDRVVGSESMTGLGPGNLVEHLGECRPESRVDAAQRPPVGLIGPEDRVISGGVGEGDERIGGGDEPCGHRQASGEVDQAEQVVSGRGGRVRLDGMLEYLGRHEGIAVTIPADPRAHTDEAGGVDRGAESLGGQLLDLGLEARHDGEQARGVVPQRLVHLVVDPEFRESQDGRLPQGEDLVADLGLHLGHRRAGVDDEAAVLEQVGDPFDDIEDRLATYLGGVSGEHRRDAHAAEREGHLVRSVLRPEKGGDGRGDSAGAFGAPGIEVETASSLEVEILRGVREQRQPAEGPHQMEHGLDRGVGEVVGQGADG